MRAIFHTSQGNDAKLTQRRGSSSHGTDSNHCSVPHHVMEIRSTNQSNKTLDVPYIYKWLLKLHKWFHTDHRRRLREKGFFFYFCPFPVFFPGRIRDSGLQRLVASLIKLEGKNNPSCAAVRLKAWSIYRTCWDFWMLALPNTEGNSEKSCCQGRRATHPAWSGCSAFPLQLPQPAMCASVNQPPGHAHVGSPAREHPQNYS